MRIHLRWDRHNEPFVLPTAPVQCPIRAGICTIKSVVPQVLPQTILMPVCCDKKAKYGKVDVITGDYLADKFRRLCATKGSKIDPTYRLTSPTMPKHTIEESIQDGSRHAGKELR
jgi:hypothetical protein